MRYVLIGVDGEYQVPGGSEQWLIDLDTQTPTRVPLAPLPDALGVVTGWVNPADTTLNGIGEQVLLALGAATGTYSGPVVITGWDGDNDEVRGLNSDQAQAIHDAYDNAQT
ncbi:hypothetical protein [Spongiactinospora sp. TRM90649]|uniref:hypothetical protein n=1 Tax=Spongiactinospora sp. TRM90649 TaxID=3031114 RepID=UPI0023F934F8|nr:hypothetical protein [Spongiactinospora sp. TRM90649]MDF5758598.1 hypothetical protein [Spongiactinospora sp. TRM90649]